jgi:hypothetical protein
MSPSPANADRLMLLASAVCDEIASEAELAELDALLVTSETARLRYLDCCTMHIALGLELQAGRAVRKAFEQIDLGPASRTFSRSAAQTAASPASLPVSVSTLGSLGNAIRGTAGDFSQGWPVAYLVATVIFGMGLVIGSLMRVSQPVQLVKQSVLPRRSVAEPKTESVGHVTGMVDCQWADASMAAFAGASVPLGRKYALASGLLEITYDRGARLIIEGPATYEVESRNSGFLAVGKLTARVETRREGGRGKAEGVVGSQWPVASGNRQSSIINQQSSNSQPPIPNPSSPFPVPRSAFTVRTPTAIVTDLGTEFGVEVNRQGLTQVHVLQGIVEARQIGQRGSAVHSRRLTEGKAVEIGRKGAEIKAVAFAPQAFARKLPRATDTPEETAYIKAVLADKPLGYWPLNEPAHSRLFRDRSGNAFHGCGMNRVAAGQSGPLGGDSRAIGLNGDGYIDVGRHDEFALASDFTVEAWVCIGKVGRYSDVVSTAAQDGDRLTGWGLGAGRRGSKNQLILFFTTYAVRDFAFPLRDDEAGEDRWLHVAVVYDRVNTAHLYLDGHHRQSIAESRPGHVGPVWVEIGGATLYNERWHGRLAHVAVYPRALSGQQIQTHYNQRNNRGSDKNQ